MRADATAVSAPVRDSISLRMANGIASFVARIQRYFARRDNIATLYAMSDRDLKDIGLSRGDLYRITRL